MADHHVAGRAGDRFAARSGAGEDGAESHRMLSFARKRAANFSRTPCFQIFHKQTGRGLLKVVKVEKAGVVILRKLRFRPASRRSGAFRSAAAPEISRPRPGPRQRRSRSSSRGRGALICRPALASRFAWAGLWQTAFGNFRSKTSLRLALRNQTAPISGFAADRRAGCPRSAREELRGLLKRLWRRPRR